MKGMKNSKVKDGYQEELGVSYKVFKTNKAICGHFLCTNAYKVGE